MKQLLYLLCVCLLLTSCNATKRLGRKAPKTFHPAAAAYTVPPVVPPAFPPVPLTPREQRQARKTRKAESKARARELEAAAKVEAAKHPRKIKNSSVATGAGANASQNGKNATGAVGAGSSATSVEKPKEQVAVGDGIKQTNAEKKAVAGEGIAVNQEETGFNWWLILIPAGLYGVWYWVAGTTTGKLLPWVPSRSWWLVLALVFGGIIYLLLRFFA